MAHVLQVRQAVTVAARMPTVRARPAGSCATAVRRMGHMHCAQEDEDRYQLDLESEVHLQTPSAAEYFKVCVKVEQLKRELAEEQQANRRLQDAMVLQQNEHATEAASLRSTNDQLRAEILELIQDLETTLSAGPGRGRSEGIECLKQSLCHSSSLETLCRQESLPRIGLHRTGEMQSPLARSNELQDLTLPKQRSIYIPCWNEITRHIQEKADRDREGSVDEAASTGCSLLTRSGSFDSDLSLREVL